MTGEEVLRQARTAGKAMVADDLIEGAYKIIATVKNSKKAALWLKEYAEYLATHEEA